MPTLNKLEYLDETKQQIKDALNTKFNSGITDSDTFRSYVSKIDNIYNNWPKVTGEGTEITLSNAKKGKMPLQPKGNTEQDSYSGINLLDTNDINFQEEARSFVSNKIGEIIINGTTTAKNVWLKQGLNKPLNGTYTLIFKKISGEMQTTNTIIRYTIGNPSNEGAASIPGRLITDVFDKDSEIITTTATINDTLDSLSMYINAGATFIDYKVAIYLVEGTYTSANIPNYEPYVGGTSPNPDYPQPIRVVTGNNTIKGNTDNYTLNLENIKLCKIGDYQDVIFKNNQLSEYYDSTLDEDSWYIKKNIGKVVLDGSEAWVLAQTNTDTLRFNCANGLINGLDTNTLKIISNNFVNGISTSDNSDNEHIRSAVLGYPAMVSICINKTRLSSQNVEDFKTWLSTHNTTVYYILATPTYEKITNETLISQLEALNNAMAIDGVNNISSEYATENAPVIISASALMKGGN